MVQNKLCSKNEEKETWADSSLADAEVAAAHCRAEGSLGAGQLTLAAAAWRKSSLLAPGSKPQQTAVLFLTQEKEEGKRALYSSKFVRETATYNAAVYSR